MNLPRKSGGWLPWILASALALRLLLFTGVQGNDDIIHYASAARLARGEAPLRGDLQQSRYALVVPIALLFKVFGPRIGCLVVPTLASSAALIVLAYALGSRWYGEKVGRISAAALAIFPLEVFYSTTSNTDTPLAAWLGAGVYALTAAADSSEPWRRRLGAVLAGLSFGAAHLTKESAALLIVPLAPLLAAPRLRRGFGISLAVLAGVIAAEALAYLLWTGDPFHRLAMAGANRSGETGFVHRLWILPSLCWGVSGELFPYTGGLMAVSAAGVVWAFARDRDRSGRIAWWWLGSGLVLVLFPGSLIPFRPALHIQARMFSVLMLPGAILASAFVVEWVVPRRPAAAWAVGALVAALSLAGGARLHGDAVQWRAGSEWAHAQLSTRPGASVVTDPRSAQVLVMFAAGTPAYTVRGYASSDPPPPPGTLLFRNPRMLMISIEWDNLQPPAWWTGPPPSRELAAELIVPAPWRLRGPRRADDRIQLSRVSGPP
jgi:hypothetical protein